MVARVTGATVDREAFAAARDTLVADAAVARLLPECVRYCRSSDEVWTYIKTQEGLDTYHLRRVFLRNEFEPLLSALESATSAPLDDLVTGAAAALDSQSVTAAWAKALERRDADPEGAITAARTLLESVCLTILGDLGADSESGDDLPKLYRAVAKVLNLAPGDHSDDQIKRILGGATSVVEGIGSLRNREGDAHGRGRRSYRPSGRHAEFAVNLAGSTAAFLMRTWEEVAPDEVRNAAASSPAAAAPRLLQDNRTVRIRVAAFMANSPGVVPLESIAATTGFDVGAIELSLALLEELGLVQRVGQGWARS